jgi:hypothetical protein
MAFATAEKYNEYSRNWAKRNRTKVNDYVAKNAQRKRQWFKEFKSTLQCKVCGETRFQCLDFHHRDPKEKEIGICKMIQRKFSIEKILKEMEKCDVLCANCHRMEHYTEEGEV